MIFVDSSITIRVIENNEDFEELKETWNTLLENCEDKNIFLTWEWMFSWWTYFGENSSLQILLMFKDKIPIAIAPFMISKYNKYFVKYRVLENIGSRHIDYSGIICAGDTREIFKSLFDYLVTFLENGTFIVKISHIPDDSVLLKKIRDMSYEYDNRLVFHETQITACPFLSIPESWEIFWSSLKRKRRHNLKRSITKLHGQFNVKYISIKPTDSSFNKLFNDFVIVYQKRWGQHKISSKFSNTQFIQFYQEICRRFANNNCLDFNIMTLNNCLASVILGFYFNKKYYYYTITFNPEFEHYSLGQIHILNIIKNSIENKLTEIDFLKGEEAYKYFWTQKSHKNYEILISKKGLFKRLRMLIFLKFLRIYEITQRSFKENYYLYIKQRNEKRSK